ncbi:hypothetical protein FUAX_11340 [Fulvitalea axinellae]|uniref:Uncharacterized protein n=1 Tax=Fulvitalea axinellae TaxID=1182444 RepID=A0AAU9CP27_9BACT|nr:hypothetical protein FUAX_11340 [Fulvitalea axinellae]
MKKNEDPREAIQETKTTMSGFVGWLTKIFLGKDFVDDTNSSLDEAKFQLDLAEKQQKLMTSGIPAQAKVLSIQDTGKSVNLDPVLTLKLNVRQDNDSNFVITAASHVSKISIPKVGDIINIRYDPDNKSSIMIM